MGQLEAYHGRVCIFFCQDTTSCTSWGESACMPADCGKPVKNEFNGDISVQIQYYSSTNVRAQKVVQAYCPIVKVFIPFFV